MVRLCGAKAERLRGPEAEAAVDEPDAAVAVEEPAGGHERPDVRLGIEVVASPADEDVRAGAVRRVGRILDGARGHVVRHQQPHRGLAGDLPAVVRVDDRAGVHERHGATDIEDFRAFEEEGAQLGIEQRKALVDLDLRLVRLDLREVRVERDVGCHVRRDPVLQVDAPLGLRVLGDEVTVRCVERAELNRREGRHDLDVAAGRHARHAVEHAHLREESGDPPRHRSPHVVLILAPDLSDDLEAPPVGGVPIALRVAEALERNRHLGGEAVVDDLAAAVEQGVPRVVATGDPVATGTTPAAPAAAACVNVKLCVIAP